MLKLPGLIDPHVHVRDPGATHKEDWASATAAALAGGFTLILAMPNTDPPVTDALRLERTLEAAHPQARCDYAQFLGAGARNGGWFFPADLPYRSAGLKMYLDSTYGDLRLDGMLAWEPHFRHWPRDWPLVVHAEGRTLAAALFFAALYERPLHVAHVSRAEEILLIRRAKEKGLPVTCEVAPHHLFLSEEDLPPAGRRGRWEVRPRLAARSDVQALWDNLEVIDCFASDHAPHTLAEKDSPHPPPGFPGLETSLPLLLSAVHAGRLSLEDLVARMYTNPRRIFRLPEQPETWVEVDEEARYEIRAASHHSKCGWTPFEGWPVQGRVSRVVLRGREVFRRGEVLAPPGFGYNLRDTETYEDPEPLECWA